VFRYAGCRRALTGKEFGRPDSEFFDRRVPDWRTCPSLVAITRMMQSAAPDGHARRRGTVHGFLTPHRVKALVATEAQAVDRLLDDLAGRLADGATAEFQSHLSYRLPSISMAALFGVPEDEVKEFAELSRTVAGAWEPGVTPDQLAAVERAYEQFRRYFEEVVAERRGRPRPDLATHIVQCHDDAPHALATDELIPMFVSLFVAGTMNTTSFIGNGVAALLRNPGEADRLRQDPSLADAAVTEILRYDAPMQITRRLALRDTVLGGARITVGQHLGVVLGSANRDPAAFPEPDRFRIGRTGAPPLSFGGGPFHCIGAALAKLEGALLFRALLTRFPDLRIAAPPTPNCRAVLRGLAHLSVTRAPHTPTDPAPW